MGARSAFLSVLLAVLAMALLAVPGSAAANPSPCSGLHISTARHSTPNGTPVRIRGRICGGHHIGAYVRIVMSGSHGARRSFRARVNRGGRFTRKVKVFAARKVKTVHIRARRRGQRSNAVSVRLRSLPTAASTTASTGPSGCDLGGPGETVGMTESGCRVIASDTAAESNPLAFWSSIQCASSSRYSYEGTGGDPHPTADGQPQGNEAFRRLTLMDGDDFSGARCELGENDHRYSNTAFYHQGEHLVTYFSERLPSNFPLSTGTWQTVMQMKQAQPADGGGGAPILEMEARTNQWVVVDDWHELWTFPAKLNTWTRFAWDVYYSNDPSQGWLQVSADLNGDGDFDDPGERSPVFHAATLKTEIEGPNGARDGLVAGEAIPSHLRLGIYHDPSIHCPAPGGCSIELDNVQVVSP